MTVHFSDKYFAMTEKETQEQWSASWVDDPHDDISENIHNWLDYFRQNHSNNN